MKNSDIINEYSDQKRMPFWFSEVDEALKFEQLNEDISTDIAIVGGGIAGLSTAYILTKAGMNVAVFEKDHIGSGETGNTTAHITNALDDRYFNLENLFGQDGATLAADSHTQAINFIESVISEEKIECNFERLDGYLFLDDNDSKETLDKEFEATHRVGIDTDIVTISPLPSFNIVPCLRFPNQAQFHPLKYLLGLCKSILEKKGRIFTETHIEEILGTSLKTSDNHNIKAKKIVIATNAPIIDKVSKIYDKQIPYRTYVIGALVKKGTVPKGLYWDTGDSKSKNTIKPYHYVRTQKLVNESNFNIKNKHSELNKISSSEIDNLELIMIGGEDHKTGNEDDIQEKHNRLIKWAKKRFPIEGILYKWSGQVMEPIDSLAFIGSNPSKSSISNDQFNGNYKKGDEKLNNNIYIATGDSGNGMTHGTIAGILISDLIFEKENKWTWLYSPCRPIKTFDKKENNEPTEKNNNDLDKKSTEDNPTSINRFQNSSLIESLAPDEGAIIEDPKNPIAVYKNKKGQVQSFSAKCTHLGCTLSWNPLEYTFDCPCHGSRFFNNGKVANAPATSKLAETKM